MKNKRIYLLLFAIALFALMLFANTTDVHASDTNYVLNVETTINNWQEGNDLIFVKVDNDWEDVSCDEGRLQYTKTVYLQESGNSTTYPITETKKLSYYSFSTGSTVKLVERYEFTGSDNNMAVERSFGINSQDYITLGSLDNNGDLIADSKWSQKTGWKKTYSDTAFEYYEGAEMGTLYAYYDSFYEGAYRYYFYFVGDNNSKTTTFDRGDINLMSFRVYTDFDLSGNLVGPDSYYWYISPSSTSSTDSFDETTDHIVVSAGQFNDIVNDNYYIYICGTPQVDNASTSFSYGSSWGAANRSSVQTSGNDYMYVTLTQSGDFSVTPPNGVFYNILPFAVAGLVAIAGIVILKKNSIK